MPSAGTRLRSTRTALGLTLRDVEARSGNIARKLKRRAYLVQVSRLSEYEHGKAVPSAFKMYSLATIYKCSISEVLSWFNIPVR